jgi:hypothetical protein
MPSSDLLARLLCYGVRLPHNIPLEYRLRHGLEHRFIQGSIFMVGGYRPVNTVVWEFASPTAIGVPLIYRDDQLWIEVEKGLISCSPLQQPPSIVEEFAEYGRVADYVKFHNPNTIFASPIRECIFGAIGKACQFCTFDMRKPKPLPPNIFTEMFLLFAAEKKGLSLAIGPGTPNLRDHGVRYIASLLHDLFDHWRGPVSVELVPPHDLHDLNILIDLNVGSFIMSIELWHDQLRDKMCPGKAYVSKAHYIDAWKVVTKALGPGKASSVLLVGLEPAESVKEGIDSMTELGVVPTLIPFRPYENIALSDQQVTDHRMYLDLSAYNISKMRQAGIGPKNQVGCTSCGGCSLDIEVSIAPAKAV